MTVTELIGVLRTHPGACEVLLVHSDDFGESFEGITEIRRDSDADWVIIR